MSLWKTDCVLLGHKGDSGTVLTFDVTPAINRWEGCLVKVIHKRPGEDTGYFAETVLDGHVLKWTVTDVDTAIAGNGSCEMLVMDGERLAYSCIAKTLIKPSEADTDPTKPPYSWEDIALYAERAETAADNAEHYADIAQAAVATKGYYWFELDEHGNMWCNYIENPEGLTFSVDNQDPTGALYVEGGG